MHVHMCVCMHMCMHMYERRLPLKLQVCRSHRDTRLPRYRTMAGRLAPLSAAEIGFAVAQTRCWAAGERPGSAPPQLVFYEIDLHECASTEAKEAALCGNWEALPPRRARVVAGEPAARRVLVGDVAVGPSDGGAPCLAERVRTQPCFAAEEYAAAERLVVEHPPFRAACAARGIAPEHVRVDPWCAGWYSAEDDPARRLSVPMLFVQERPEDNLYARPLEGIRMKLDLWATPPAVVSFLDAQRVPLPPRDPLMNFPSASTARAPLAPLLASQPQGASFALGPGGLLPLPLPLPLTRTLALTP
jgi:Cu2+-containing amine oxidase